jgi:glycosyltransferase involved in cell wall biosynthesis
LTDKYDLTVAVPWSLSHYIPLNGFHPIYRALIDERPDTIKIYAWDNVALSQRLKIEQDWRYRVMARSLESANYLSLQLTSKFAKPYIAHFWPSNIALTDMLPGVIEFHHTAPFPTLTRPFVFHCESFAPVFFPFAHQGTGKFYAPDALRTLYRHIFKSPLCLGICSHIPETLRDFSQFFKDTRIDNKLHQSRIGLSANAIPSGPLAPKAPLTKPRFLFINSAHQHPDSFFLRGGHIALRFWQAFRDSGHSGRLYMRCCKPSDGDLVDYGVDIGFIKAEEQKSIFWIEGYLENYELNALVEEAHFFLLPSNSLHSASIMQALTLGCVPIVTDTVGTSLYVQDDENGIVLKGVFNEYWAIDNRTGILIDKYRINPKVDAKLVTQLTQRIIALMAVPHKYQYLRGNALKIARQQFSGSVFSEDFWRMTTELYFKEIRSKNDVGKKITELHEDIIENCDFRRVFESVPQPLRRINSGIYCVSELGGAFIQHDNIAMGLHNWSVMGEFALPNAAPVHFSRTIRDLGGGYLEISDNAIPNYRENEILRFFSRLLKPFPRIHRFLAKKLDSSMQTYFRLFYNKGHYSNNPDIQMALEGLYGFNIIRANSTYFGIPQYEGGFNIKKARSNGYRICLTGQSLDEVRQKIIESVDMAIIKKVQKKIDVQPELIFEGVNGFNVILFSEMYYAIPQSEGAFDYGRILSNDYSCIFSGQTADQLLQVIKENRN